jgi:beta-glucosidase
MSEIAQLFYPAIRWDPVHGFEGERAQIDHALKLGVGGFILFGGPSEHVAALTEHLHSKSKIPLLIGADMERGAGQQFAGQTALPPLAAIASLGDLLSIRRAASLTALEAKSLGLNWIYAPDCDLDVEPTNPIVGTRSLGGDPERVAEYAAAWIDACQVEGVLACAKHFPGHGRTTTDSHKELPRVDASADVLRETDLIPFRRAISVGVASVMTAHVAFPSMDPAGLPATLSREIVTNLLRLELGFAGLIVTDALVMEGVRGAGEADAVVAAARAGCDCLLYPSDLAAAERAVADAIDAGRLDPQEIKASLDRRIRWARWAALSKDTHRSESDESGWATALGERVIHMARGTVPQLSQPIHLVIVDDDIGGPHSSPSRDPLISGLRAGGADVVVDDEPAPDGTSSTVVALFADIRAWKGRPGCSSAAKAAVQRAVEGAGSGCVIILFGHPRLVDEIESDAPVLCAWGGEAVMQRAAARVILHELSDADAHRGVRTAG